MTGLMNQAEYARHRGVSRQAIHKLVAAGKIPVDAAGRINAADADFALGENRARIDEPAHAAPAPIESSSAGLTKARTANEVYKARLSQLEYERALGRVVPTEGVATAAMQCAETVQRVVRRLPGRAEEVAAAAAKDGIAGVRVALKTIERDLLSQLSQAFENLAAEAVAGGEAQDEPAELASE